LNTIQSESKKRKPPGSPNSTQERLAILTFNKQKLGITTIKLLKLQGSFNAMIENDQRHSLQQGNISNIWLERNAWTEANIISHNISFRELVENWIPEAIL
jgi:hypothetical protein